MKTTHRAALSFIVFLLTAYFSQIPIVQRLELWFTDVWFQARGPVDPHGDYAIVAVDELSYKELNVPLNQAWPRVLHAQLLDRLTELGAKRVVFDVIFADAGAKPEDDEALARALMRLPTVLGIERSEKQMYTATGAIPIEEWLEPHEPFRRAAAGLGLVSLPSSNDVIRIFPRTSANSGRRVITLSEAAAGVALGDGARRPGPRDLINYYGPAQTIPVHSFWEVVQRTLPFPDSEIRGKTIVVGFLLRSDTGAAQKDAYPNPFGGPTVFGVEVHATAAANIAHGDWISRPGSVAVEATASGVAGAMLAFAALSLTPVLFSVVAAVAFAVWVIVAFVAWTSGVFIPGAFVVGVLSPAFLLGSSLYFYVIVKRSEQNIRSAFELYVSPEMVPKLGAQGRTLNQLGGEKLWLTALFTDIQDFTSIAEEMPAERVSEMLNAYFTEVVDVIFQNQGTLLKFIGDAVFALWGAPIKIPNHAEFAVKTALALCKEIDTFNASGRFPRLHTRIGIHTGPMVVGNLGSKRRLDYTAIGDAVNLASRVEGLNKYLGTTILFTDATRRDAGDSIIAVRVATVRPKGRRELANLFTTFDPPLEASVKTDWEQALVEFSERRFERASELFLATRMRDVRCEATALFYEGLCREFLQEPPAPGWVGELQFDKK